MSWWLSELHGNSHKVALTHGTKINSTPLQFQHGPSGGTQAGQVWAIHKEKDGNCGFRYSEARQYSRTPSSIPVYLLCSTLLSQIIRVGSPNGW